MLFLKISKYRGHSEIYTIKFSNRKKKRKKKKFGPDGVIKGFQGHTKCRLRFNPVFPNVSIGTVNDR